ncbi:acyltransferase family protein [Lentilactobacillus senioris]|uniref:acyltransferase family protein n=1 Tax=Lentilactobacillus senioris TaxID=931534 RepID=UPI003D29E56B
MKKRIQWVDIAKGIGIIAVVISHAIHPIDTHFFDVSFKVLYWWHMPLFFIIGGFFLKPIVTNWEGIWGFFKKKVWPNIVIYFVAGTFLILASHYLDGSTWAYTRDYFIRLIYGGRSLNDNLTVFWFITVYTGSLITTTAIISWIKNVPAQFITALSMFAVGVSYKHWDLVEFKFLDMDVVLITTFYMLVGYYVFKHLKETSWHYSLGVAIMGLYLFLIYLSYNGHFKFRMFLKAHTFNNTFLLMYLPLVLCFGIFIICIWMEQTSLFGWLSVVGKHSMIIMYLHRLTFDYFNRFMIFRNWESQVILGVIVPLLIGLVYEQIKRQLASRKRLRNDSN